MQQQRSIIDEVKHHYNNGGLFMKLIFINVIVFLVINLLGVIGRLSHAEILMDSIVLNIFTLQTDLTGFVSHFWGLFTSIFSHEGILHILFNMLMLYSFGRLFLSFFSQKRLLYTYILGGVFGGLFEIISTLFPAVLPHAVIGASGAVMAIVFAVASYRPQLELNLFGAFKVKLWIIAAILFLANFLNLGMENVAATGSGTAHFAHIGGAVLGFLSVQNLRSSSNIINMASRFGDWFKSLFRKKPKLSVEKGDARRMTDEEYNQQKKQQQEQVDRILDKISKSGYESLSKKEKDFLFRQSK